MNRITINSSKTYFIVGIMLLLLVVASSFSIMYGKVQAAPGDATSYEGANISSGYCSASRSLAHRAILQRLGFLQGINIQRLNFALSDGRGDALGLRSGDTLSENVIQPINIQRLDFALSDGRGNALGLRSDDTQSENELGALNLQRLDFALSDGRGNALGLHENEFSLASNVMAAICP